MDRLEIQLTLLRDWTEFFEAVALFDDDMLEREATQDQHDPEVWWTVKDHVAHCHELSRAAGAVVAEVLAGADNPFIIPRTDHRADFSKPLEENLRLIDEGTHVIWTEVHDLPWSEVTRLGQISMSERLALVASLTDEQLAMPVPGSVWGDGTLGAILISDGNHNRTHLMWVAEGLARADERAAAGG